MTTTRMLLPVLRQLLTTVNALRTPQVRLTMQDQRLEVSALGLAGALWVAYPLDDDHAPLDAQLNGQRLAEWLATLSENEIVTLTPMADGRLRVAAAKATSHLQLTDSTGAPTVVSAEQLDKFRAATADPGIPADLLAEALARVTPALSRQMSHQVLTSVQWAPTDGGLRLTCADGVRLATAVIPTATASDLPALIVPEEMARILVKVLPDTGAVHYQVLTADDDTPTAVCCYWQLPNRVEVVWVSQLLAGQYPDFTKIMAQRDGYPLALPLNGPALMRALRQAQALQPQTLRLVLQSATLQVCARNADGGELTADFSLETPLAAPLDVWFNPKFLTDGVKLAVRPAEQTTLYLKEAHKPGFLVSEGALRVTYALMPLDPSKL